MYFAHNHSPNHPRFIPVSPPSQICIIFFSHFFQPSIPICAAEILLDMWPPWRIADLPGAALLKKLTLPVLAAIN